MRRLQVSRLLAILATLLSVYILIRLWPQIAPYQDMWPLPGLYLLEMVWLPLIGVALTFLDYRWAVLGMWAKPGAVLGFAILGALTVGPAYLPVFLLLAVSTFLRPAQDLRQYLGGLAVGICGGAVQIGYMLAVLKVLQQIAGS
jgi:hypothetical protein